MRRKHTDWDDWPDDEPTLDWEPIPSEAVTQRLFPATTVRPTLEWPHPDEDAKIRRDRYRPDESKNDG